MKIFLTGATGFLGSALARRWAADGHDVVALVRSTASLARLKPVREQLHLAVIDDLSAVVDQLLCARPDAIVHTACAYGRAGESMLEMFDANMRLGLLLLEGADRLERSRAILFINTGTVLDATISPYALSKQQYTAWGRLAAEREPGRLRFLNARLQHMYGPNDSPSKFTTHVIRACRDSVPTLELTSGVQHRDFIYVDDVVDAYTTLLLHADAFDGYRDVDVGSGVAPTVRSFVESVHRLTGARTELRFGAVPLRPNEAMHCQADIGLMRSLGWEPSFDLEAGICRTLDLESTTT